MQEYRFKRVETATWDITVRADSYEQAYAKAVCGIIPCIRAKENVEVSDCIENTTTEEINDGDD